MKVENIIEHEDGSATVTLNMSSEEHQIVMEGALIRAISLGMTAKHEGWSGFTPEEWRTIVNNAIEAKHENNNSR
jgi:hypothetical protein